MAIHSKYPQEPIAIIGSACRFPGESSSPSKLWDLLRQPRDVSSAIPDSRFTTNGFYNSDPLHHGTTNVRRSYLLNEDVRHFDAQFFGIKPVEAISVDPQQRILMETVYEGLENAGIPMEKLQGSQTGVYVGLMCGDYAELLGRDIDTLPTYFGTGTARSIISNRVSYFFDWHGPSMTIDTACSSSLIALHQAVQSLRSGEIPTAVVAGSNLLLSPGMYVAESKLKMLSPTGRSRMWDKDADGYARGDGVGALVLKTLSQALADGDAIECLVRQTGINQDGRTKGITMPSSVAQAALISDTYKKAGLDISHPSDRPQYFEAHGTGTPAGDPMEAEAISTAFFGSESGFRSSPSDAPLYVGSIKTVIGHTEGTAGIAGLIKGSLALQHGIIPPNLHLNDLNPAIKPFYGDLEIAKQAKEWPSLPEGVPRRVSINSFGFGGANAHAILESYSPTPEAAPGQDLAHLSPFNISASSNKALSDLLANYSSYLKANPSVGLRNLSWTLNARRSTLPVRATVAARTAENLISKLDELALDSKGIVTVNNSTALSLDIPSLLGVFTGQGAQWPAMGAQLILGFKTASDTIDKLQASLKNLPLEYRPTWSLREELLKGKEASRVAQGEISQPLCAAVQIVLVALFKAANIRFKAVVGHSSGEIVAAYAAGYISEDDAIRIAYLRGFFLNLAKGPKGSEAGGMLAAGTTYDDAQGLVDLPDLQGRIVIAASNSPESVTLSGDLDAIEEAKDILDDEEKFARLLKVDKAYHSHHMVPASSPYIEALHKLGIRVQQPPSIGEFPVWTSSVYGEDIDSVSLATLGGEYWSRNMVSPVLFSQAVEYVVGAHGPFDFAIEVGPHPALKGPTLSTIQAITGQPLPYTGVLRRGADDVEAFGEGLGFLWQTLGEKAVDFTSLERNAHGIGVSAPAPVILKDLPNYAWEHDREYWHESRYSKALRNNYLQPHQLLGSRVPDGTQNEARWRNYLNIREIPWLVHHQIQRQIIFPAAGYLSAVVEAMVQLFGQGSIQIVDFSNVSIGQALVLEDNGSSAETLLTFRETATHLDTVEAVFAFYSGSSGKTSTGMNLNASGKLSITLGSPANQSLPEPYNPKGQFLDIDHERFYTETDKLGFGYTGPFRKLINTRRKMDEAIGEIQTPDLADEGDTPLIIHPGTLDSAIQSLMLAFAYPGDGRLRSIYLPTGIDRLQINPSAYAQLKGPSGSRLAFHASVDPDHPASLKGDFEVSSADRRVTLIQLQGLSTTPLVPASADNDLNLFTETTWAPESPAGNTALVGTDPNDYTLAFEMERVAYYYMRGVDKVVPQSERHSLEWHHQAFYRYFEHQLGWVAKGTHPFAKKDWINDTDDDILQILKKYPDSTDIRLLQTVGENLPKAVRKELNILEVMFKDNLLNDFYSHGFGMQRYLVDAARVVSELSHRFPHQDIIEIGAGTGSATNEILRQLQGTFTSYTYTDVSSGFFEQAQERFEEHRSQLIFKVLDIEKDVAEQGFVPYSYDLVVASLVLHATRNLTETMANSRKLLKPGGRLVMVEVTDNDPLRLGLIFAGLPGLWLGDEGNRKLSPCVSAEEWEVVMRETGFSGIDVITPHNRTYPLPLSVITFQAVDDRVEFLREPLAPTAQPLSLEFLTIIGGGTPRTAELSQKVQAAVGRHYNNVVQVKTLDEISTSGLPLLGSVVSLVDLEDTPLFKNITSEKLVALKELFKQSKSVLWASHGTDADAPYRNMYRGLERSVKTEMTHLQSQLLEFGSAEAVDASLIAKKLLHLEASVIWEQSGRLSDLVWYIEPEFRVQDGAAYAPRIKLSKQRTERYNSARRFITREVSSEAAVVSVRHNGSEYVVEANDAEPGVAATCHMEIRLLHSLLNPIRVTPSTFLYLSVGENVKDSNRVLVLSDSLASRVHVPEQWTVPLLIEDAPKALVSLSAHLTAELVLSSAKPGDTLVILDPDFSSGNLLAKRALEKLVTVVLLSTTSAGEILTRPWSYIHPRATKQVVRKVLPAKLRLFANLGSQHNLANVIKGFLPLDASVLDQHWLTPSPAFPVGADSTELPGIANQLQVSWTRSNTDFTPPGQNFPVASLASLASRTTSHTGQAVLSWPPPSENIPVQVQPAGDTVRFAKDKTYWLVGLTGGLGLSLCEWMAKHGAGYIVLSSRNPKLDSDWLQSMADLGCTVRAFSNDITDREAVRSLHKRLTETLPPIAGVAQGAMVLDDAMFPDLDLERLHKVSRPKVEGSVWLDEIFSEDTLDWFVFFSSITYVTGNAGQSAYAASNGFMTSLAAERRRRGLAGSAMNIGVIMGNGYVSRELTIDQQAYLHRVGHWWMSEQDFHQIFAECVLASRPGSSDSPEFITGLRIDNDDKKNWIDNPIFQHLVSKSIDAVASTSRNKSGIMIKAQLQEAATQEQVFEILKDGLLHKLQVVLQADPNKPMLELNPDELGVDSLVAVDIRSWFLKEPGIDLPVLKILNSPSVRELVLSAQELLPDTAIPLVSGTSVPANTTEEARLAEQETPVNAVPIPLLEEKDTTVHGGGDTESSSSPTSLPTPATEVDSLNLAEQVDAGLKDLSQLENDLLAERIVPMSFGQSRFWFLKHYVQDQTAFNITTVIKLSGKLQVDPLEKAVVAVGQRHEALRTYFFTDVKTKNHMQGVLPNSVLQLEREFISSETEVDEAAQHLKDHVYDLANGEVLRIKLLSISPDQHWLLLGYHHINMDGIGYVVFLTDLEKAFHRQLNTNPAGLLQYPDFTLRQYKEYEEGAWVKELSFWRDQFSTLPDAYPLLPLSRLSSRPNSLQLGSHSASSRLEKDLTDKIDKVCARFKVTPFQFYLAVFHILLFRHAGDLEDITIGVADGNRRDADVIQSLGMYLNLLPLRFKRNSRQSFAEALRDVQNVVQNAFSNARVPFDVLLQEINVPRAPSHSPLFQTFLNYRQNIKEARSVFGVEGELDIISAGQNNYDISIDILENSSGGSNLVTIAVQKDLYRPEAAQSLLRSYQALLRQLVDNPAARVSWPALHDKGEVNSIIEAARGAELTPEYPTLVHRIDVMAAKYTEQTSLKDLSGNVLTYDQLLDRVSVITEQLSSHNIGKGSRVGVFQNAGPDWIISLLAILRVGAAYVPFDPKLGADRLSLVASDSAPAAFLVDSDTESLEFARTQSGNILINVSNLPSLPKDGRFPNRAEPNEPAIIMYTSGSTGTPKGIVLTHSNWNNWVDATPATWDIREGQEVGLQQSSYTFDMSLLQIFTILSRGGALIIPGSDVRHDPAALFKLVAEEQITYTCCTPTEYLAWIRYGSSEQLKMSSWRLAVTGGEAISNQVIQEFRALGKPDLQLFNCYGPTETTIGCGDAEILYNKVETNIDTLDFPLRATRNYSVYIVDDHLNPVPADVPGEVVIGGAGVALGYLNNDELTSEKFVSNKHASPFFKAQGWTRIHRSGDRGRLTQDGRLVLLGRLGGDTQVKLGGIRIDLEDIEATISQHNASVRRAIVSSRKSSGSDTPFLVAFVVLSNPNLSPEEKKRLLEELPRKLPLPQYMQPALAVEIETLPTTSAGKLDRRAIDDLPLPEEDSGTVESLGTPSNHLSASEQALRDIWIEALPTELAAARRSTISSQADFFHVGGSSLSLINVQSLIKDRLGVSVSLYQLFEKSSLSDMASLIRREESPIQADAIDWEEEAALSLDLHQASELEVPATSPGVVVLTGATGFIGRELLRRLIDDHGITKIHCLAVRRNLSDLPAELFHHDKVAIYTGDLGAPRLGLSEEQAETVFNSAHAVIHAGADVSFMKTYHSLKLVNVASTKELVRLSIPYRLPLHFVSSAGVARLSGRDAFGPESIAPYPPPQDRPEGYIAAKWVSETYLERAAERFALPVWIHRPSSVTGDTTSDLDLMANMLKYTERTRSIADSSALKGQMDFISVQAVASSILREVIDNDPTPSPGSKVRYLYQAGETVLHMEQLQSVLEQASDEAFEVLPLEVWIDQAEAAGLNPLLGLYLRQIADGQMLLPKLTNDE
ncbi:hypothetical protein AJ80_05108 [Polytolypa hystricis UAMH7299]|uniref:Non-reducing polyketide synthase nscA n=1 Tax=Polytolypa hystricis (strain UAMH7299) TaxID=1447883 RepID=A0A2B7Y6X3_POLH7|nr:hypothetical protein AJ80_05108 [Polytolypa hystricis UAMH7299]